MSKHWRPDVNRLHPSQHNHQVPDALGLHYHTELLSGSVTSVGILPETR